MKKIMKNWILWILVFKNWTGVLSFLSPAEGKKNPSFILFWNFNVTKYPGTWEIPRFLYFSKYNYCQGMYFVSLN